MQIKYRIVAGACIVLGFIPGNVLAYGRSTHAYLTAEVFDLYNRQFPDQKLSEEWKAYLMNGSRHEDEELRWMNHFYDPVYNRGLTYDPKIDPAFVVIQSMAWKSSKEWAKDKNAQEALRYKIIPALASLTYSEDKDKQREEEVAGVSLGVLENDFTWQRAIRFYVRGEREKAMFILGHILHLIEDASVPDHTRNDPHPDSPYEHWTLQFNLGSPDPRLKKRLANKSPLILNGLSEYFDSMANFSNNNFYSKDTIGIQSGYAKPFPDEFEKTGDLFSAIKNLDGTKIILNKQTIALNLLFRARQGIVFDDPDVFNSYWAPLSVEAIQHGAGVINLFFEEVERAAKDPNFDLTEPKTQLGQAVDTVANMVLKAGDGIASFGNKIASWGNSLNGTGSGTRPTPHAHIDETLAISTSATSPASPAASSTPNKAVARLSSSTPRIIKKPQAVKLAIPTPETVVPPREITTSARGEAITPPQNLQGGTVLTTPASSGGSSGSSSSGGTAQTPPPPPEVITDATSTEPLPPPESARVLISETLYDPEGDDDGEEFVELYNPGATAISLDKWVLRYSTAASTSTPSLATFGGRNEDKVSIPAKGFFLIGLNNYDRAVWQIGADVVRAASLPNGGSAAEPEEITIFLEDEDGVRIDALSYTSLSTAAGQSLERKARSGDECVEARGDFEGAGNGCDTGSAADFAARSTPQPQNSESLSEPRTPPEIRGLSARYVPEKLEVEFSWQDQAGMSYAVERLEVGTSTLMWEGAGSSADVRIWETGRNYHFRWSVTDAGGLASTREFSFEIPSLVEAYFYLRSYNGSTQPVVKLRYSSIPFVPRLWSGSEMLWQGVAAYLDRDPNPQNEVLQGPRSQAPADSSGMLRLSPENTEVAVFGLSAERCVSLGLDDISRHCMLLSAEDLEVELPVQTPPEFAPDDYITLAFYDFNRDGNMLQVVAADRTKVHFSTTPPSSLPPMPPSELTLGFNRLDGVLNLSWATSTDPDSRDDTVQYEWQVTSSTEFSANNWTDAGPVTCCDGTAARFKIAPTESYLVGVRAKDPDGNVSPPQAKSWAPPAGYFPYILSGSYGNASQKFQVPVAGSLSSIQVFDTRANLPGPNENAFVCSLALYEVADPEPVLIATNDTPHPGDGSSADYAVRGYECGGQPAFTFASHPNIEPGKVYRWNFSITPNGSVRFYGRGDDVANGAFSGPEMKNAIFMVQGRDGVILDTR